MKNRPSVLLHMRILHPIAIFHGAILEKISKTALITVKIDLFCTVFGYNVRDILGYGIRYNS